MESKWLTFRDASPMYSKRTTSTWALYSKQGDNYIGQVRWYGPWRQYCFFPERDTIWNGECLGDVQAFVQTLMEQRELLMGKQSGATHGNT